tara:strand:+ start:5719 stop:6066 length:348 start_codon:yes stop_codon:yes gene_type:complete
MRKYLLAAVAVFTLASCARQKPLYDWHDYDRSSYFYQKDTDKESIKDLLDTYHDMIKEQKEGTRGVIPPGVYADYGFLLLQEGDIKKGSQMLERELKLYPESKIFIDRILKMIEE